MRRHELDGLRAVAATMVVLFHCLVAVAMPHGLAARLHLGPAGSLANGSAAVVLFFVLSGFVLASSWSRDAGARGTTAFLVRRLLRIYPAWVAALLWTWLASFLYPGLPEASGLGAMMRKSLEVHLAPGDLLRSLALPGAAFGQLPQGWSLIVELQLSFLLPALVALAVRWGTAVLLALASATLFVSSNDLFLYALPFTLGIALALRGGALMAASDVAARVTGPMATLAFFLPPGWLWPVSPALGVATASLGAVVLVALVLQRRGLARLFAAPWLVRVGERSYGLYLFHFAVVCLAAPFVVGDAPAPDMGTAVARWLALVAIVLPVSLVLAFASWRWIEAPAIEAGRRLSRRIAGRAG